MTATDELKPCPFCGSRVLYGGHYVINGFEVPGMFCNWCKTMFTVEGADDWVTDKKDGMDELIAAWNRRAEDSIDATLGRRTTTRHGKFRTKYGRSVPCCECCGYGIGDARWHYCPSCGAEVVDG